MSRRPLAALITEVVDALVAQPAALAGTRVTECLIDLPVEIGLRIVNDDLVLSGDLPRWRWRSAFDTQPGRFVVRLVSEEPL